MDKVKKCSKAIAADRETLRRDSALHATGDETDSEEQLVSSNDEVSLNQSRRLASDVSDENHSLRLRMKTRIATWNVRSLKGEGKLELLCRELDRYDIDITGLSEVRWKGEGYFSVDDGSKVYYSGGNGSERGVVILLRDEAAASVIGYRAVNDRIMTVRLSGKPFNITLCQVYAPTSSYDDDKIECFYETLQDTIDLTPSQDILVIMGDFNAKVGKGRTDDGSVGPHGLGNRNDRGDRLVQFCADNDMTICNTLFQHHPRRLYTWISPGDRVRNQIDYILIKQRWKSSIVNSRTLPSADIDSDHNLLYADVCLKLKRLKKSRTIDKYDLESIKAPESRYPRKICS